MLRWKVDQYFDIFYTLHEFVQWFCAGFGKRLIMVAYVMYKKKINTVYIYNHTTSSTWRIIPVSKCLLTPFISHLEGEQPYLWGLTN